MGHGLRMGQARYETDHNCRIAATEDVASFERRFHRFPSQQRTAKGCRQAIPVIACRRRR